MATKEEIERDYEALREEHEKLKLRYKEVATKLSLAHELLGKTVDHLTETPPVQYGTPGQIIPMREES